MRADLDVLVVGGGTAGISATIQAARSGARTGLIEKNGALGGTTTVAGVAFPGLFHAWGQQIISGIGWDLVSRAVSIAGTTMPDFSDWRLPHYKLQIPLSAPIYAAVVDDAVNASGADLLLHTMIGEAEWMGDRWRAVICGKEGLRTVHARRIVDCTGDADVVALAGLARLRNPRRQPGTIMVRFTGYDLATLDFETLDEAHARAVDSGELLAHDLASADRPMRKFLRHNGENSIHVTDIDGGTSESRTRAEISARQTMLRIYRFLKRQPGLEAVSITSWAVECGIRESYTIDALGSITVNDYRRGVLHDDAVSYSFYPIDVHQPDGDGIDIRPLEYGIIPSIPRRAMIPRENGNMIVAGRAIGGDQEANSAYRVQASCMGMGQAAGAIAALSSQTGVPMQHLDIANIHAELRAHGAIIPGEVSVPPLPHELAASTGARRAP